MSLPIGFCVLTIILAYLMGAIPSSVWIGKLFYGIDVREHGSGNAGTTNTFRVLGVKAGIPVFIIDALKGWAAVKLITFSDYFILNTDSYVTFSLILGLAAVLGHIFPVYVGFRGGKGVATLVGVVLAVHPLAALISLGIFAVVLIISRYVSLSSITAGFSFPLLIIFVFKTAIISMVIFSIIVALLLLLTHQRNIDRLIRHKESRAKLFGHKKKKDDTA